MTSQQKTSFFKELNTEGLIGDASLSKIIERQNHPLFSVHWEIKTILYLGIVLLTGGIGVLIYQNIDTIGHQVILVLIALLSAGCLAYCLKHKKPFGKNKVETPNTFFDYVLLLGTISLVTFVGYLQFQYNVFGSNYGLATLIPMVALFYIAYNFDHIGILNMAIASLAVWLGVSVTPKLLISMGTFNSQSIIYSYMLLGVMLLAAAWLTQKFKIKKHFKFSYLHYGTHVSLITALAGYFVDYNGVSMLWIMALLLIAAFIFVDAYKSESFYFILITVLYSYFAISCLFVRGVTALNDIGAFYLLFLYVIGSAIALVFLLIYLIKSIKKA